MSTRSIVNKLDGHSSNRRKDLLFCLLLLIWPTIQFCIFYVAVNANSFLLAFQYYDLSNKTTITSVDIFVENFNNLIKYFESFDFNIQIRMSFHYWGVGVLIGTPLGLLFSYYISKKFRGSGFFRVILYLPSIISGLILMIIYRYLLEYPMTQALGFKFAITSQDNPVSIRVFFLCLFNIWFSFGTSVLMYSNAMSEISPEILESASLDGAKGIKEFIHITFPMIFSTFSVFFVTSVAQIFVNQSNLYSMYSSAAPLDMQNVGYYMYVKVAQSATNYSSMAILGIALSIVVIPVTLIIRALLNRYGPSSK